MLGEQKLRAIAAEAGDEVIPGLWSTSDHAQLAVILDMYDTSEGKPGPEWEAVRAELLEQAAEITDRIRRRNGEGPDAR